MSKNLKKDVVQTKNPRTGKYLKIDRTQGKIISSKSTVGPYNHISILRIREGQQ